MSDVNCYRLPDGVVFQRWAGEDEYVVYHSGTGETLRLSEAAVAILDLLERMGPLGAEALMSALADMMDAPPDPLGLSAATDRLLEVLLKHECIDRVPCE